MFCRTDGTGNVVQHAMSCSMFFCGECCRSPEGSIGSCLLTLSELDGAVRALQSPCGTRGAVFGSCRGELDGAVRFSAGDQIRNTLGQKRTCLVVSKPVDAGNRDEPVGDGLLTTAQNRLHAPLLRATASLTVVVNYTVPHVVNSAA